jgi:GT2 family glycosyltransferase
MSQGSDLPPASVIVCTRDRPQLVEEAVRSIAEHAYPGVEIVVVDQSVERHAVLSTVDRLGACELVYRQLGATGLSRARNAGAAAAGHDVLVFGDDDVLATAGWPARLVAALVAGGSRSVATGMVTAGEPERADAFVYATVLDAEPSIHEGRLDGDVLAGGNTAMRRSALDEVGSWDERMGAGTRYPAAEDNDFGFRLLEAGYRIVYVPDAVLVHRAWRPKGDYVNLRWRYGRGKGAFYAKHASLTDRHILRRAARDLWSRVRRLPWGLRHSRRQVLGDAAYVAGVLSAACQWLVSERSG